MRGFLAVGGGFITVASIITPPCRLLLLASSSTFRFCCAVLFLFLLIRFGIFGFIIFFLVERSFLQEEKALWVGAVYGNKLLRLRVPVMAAQSWATSCPPQAGNRGWHQTMQPVRRAQVLQGH